MRPQHLILLAALSSCAADPIMQAHRNNAECLKALYNSDPIYASNSEELKAHHGRAGSIQRLSDNSYPTSRETRMAAYNFEAGQACRSRYVGDIAAGGRPDAANIMANHYREMAATMVTFVQGKMTWSEIDHQMQRTGSDMQSQLVAADEVDRQQAMQRAALVLGAISLMQPAGPSGPQHVIIDNNYPAPFIPAQINIR